MSKNYYEQSHVHKWNLGWIHRGWTLQKKQERLQDFKILTRLICPKFHVTKCAIPR